MPSKSKIVKKNRLDIFSLVLLASLVAGFSALLGLIIIYTQRQAPLQPATQRIVASKGEPAFTQSTTANNSATSSAAQPGSNKISTSGSTAINLVAPGGDFVSSHHIYQSTMLVSVCNTTPGATCNITFTDVSTGTQKSLGQRTADQGGSVYWNNWTPLSIGLYPGTWHIQATAAIDGQSKSTADATDLQVSA